MTWNIIILNVRKSNFKDLLLAITSCLIKSIHSYMSSMLLRMPNGFIWNKITFQFLNVTRKLLF
jgi:hypothetical protein